MDGEEDRATSGSTEQEESEELRDADDQVSLVYSRARNMERVDSALLSHDM